VDPSDALARSIATTQPIVDGVGAEQLELPTPCTEWRVRPLLNHIVGSLWVADALLSDRDVPYGMGPGALPSTDLLGGDPAVSYKEAAEAAMAATCSPGAVERPHQTPLGEMPGAGLAGLITLDVFVHGWDLARATNQPAAFDDDDLTAHVFEFAQQAVTEATRGPLVAPPVPVADTAPLVDRLIGFMGRQP
jgi:uncharacterized protein (TIGR03086 family)